MEEKREMLQGQHENEKQGKGSRREIIWGREGRIEDKKVEEGEIK